MPRGDTAELVQAFAPELEWTSGASGATAKRPQLVAALRTPPPTGTRFEVDSIAVTTLGPIALVQLVRTDHWPIGVVGYNTRSRVAQVYVSRNGTWQLVRHTQTWIPKMAESVSLDSFALSAFVGRYEIRADYIDTVVLKGSQLVATATGEVEGARLVPIAATVFRPDGVGAPIAFERNEAGRITGYVQTYPDGTVFRARRLP